MNLFVHPFIFCEKINGVISFSSCYRMWDIDKEENFVLNLEGQQGYSSGEIITCISFCTNKGRKLWVGDTVVLRVYHVLSVFDATSVVSYKKITKWVIPVCV